MYIHTYIYTSILKQVSIFLVPVPWQLLRFILKTTLILKCTKKEHSFTTIFSSVLLYVIRRHVLGFIKAHNQASIKYSRTRLKRHRFVPHLVYSVRYSVLSMNSSLLNITVGPSDITTPVYNDETNMFSLFRNVITDCDCTCRNVYIQRNLLFFIFIISVGVLYMPAGF